MTDLAVIIVTWNVRDLALNALKSLCDDLQQAGLSSEIHVVDNASSDGTSEAIKAHFPDVHVIALSENLGFVRANNLALRQIGFDDQTDKTPPRAMYLLNPDTLTHPGATRILFDALMSNDKCGLVGARLEYEDGSFQHGAFHFPGLRQLWVEFFPTPGRLIEGEFNGRYSQEQYNAGKPFPVDFTLGATMMLRREVVQQVGLLDEQFFMYCEEVDWAWRIKRAGWEVMCVPRALVTHLSGQSTGQARPQSILYLWTSRLLLFRRYFPAWKFFIARLMIAVGMLVKARQARAAGYSQNDLQAVLDAYQTIFKLALGRQQKS